jgi:hypothetical protein
MRERYYWLMVVLLPGLAMAAIAGYAAGAGCYAIWMNCFSVVQPSDLWTRAMFAVAAFVPFGAPSYAPIAAAGWAALRRGGESSPTHWLWLAPPAYTILVHASCIAFAFNVMPERRIHPSPAFDAVTLAAGFAYVALARVAKRWLVRKPRYWPARWPVGG